MYQCICVNNYILFKVAKKPPVINVFIVVLKDTGSSWLEFHYLKSIIMARGPSNVIIFQISAFKTIYEGFRTLKSLKSYLWFWRTLEFTDSGFIIWKVYEWVIDLLMYICFKFESTRLNIRVPRTLLSLLSLLRLWRTLEVPDWSFDLADICWAWFLSFIKQECQRTQI